MGRRTMRSTKRGTREMILRRHVKSRITHGNACSPPQPFPGPASANISGQHETPSPHTFYRAPCDQVDPTLWRPGKPSTEGTHQP
jgi:hypothetical protein